MPNFYSPFVLSLSKDKFACSLWFDKITTNGLYFDCKFKLDSRLRGNDVV